MKDLNLENLPARLRERAADVHTINQTASPVSVNAVQQTLLHLADLLEPKPKMVVKQVIPKKAVRI